MASNNYTPPYTITPHIISLIAQICELLGRLSVISEQNDLQLRRINQIKTIRGSLAIEGNTLSEEQISTILDGKPVIAPLNEVQEVRNAIKAYDHYMQWNPESETDLLKAHEIMTLGLVDVPGQYRKGSAGVMGPSEVVHIAPPARRVPGLMTDLLNWLRESKEHALIKSCVFHYEFEFIHPFADGNGRMGRLWQSLILTHWNRLFADIPVESMIYAHQQEYYQAIAQSTKEGQSTVFIEFMLDTICSKIIDCTNRSPQATQQATQQVTQQVKRLLEVLRSDMSGQEILTMLGLKDRMSMTNLYLRPALHAELIEMTIPDKPNSPNQKYRITDKGRAILAIETKRK